MMPVRIDNWSVVFLSEDALGATMLDVPVRGRLHGNVSGHERLGDQEGITTTPIVETNGRLITTNSGTVYELGDANEDYIQWVHENLNPDWDPNKDNAIFINEDPSEEQEEQLRQEDQRVKQKMLDELSLMMTDSPSGEVH